MRVLLLGFLAVATLVPHPAYAILPPELLVSVGSNLVQIFGLLAIIVVSVYSTIATLALYGFTWVKRYGLWIMCAVTAVAGGLLYYHLSAVTAQMNKQEETIRLLTAAAEQLQTENALLGSAHGSTTHLFTTCVTDSSSTTCLLGRKFFSDSYVLVGKGLVLEIDLNRIELAAKSNIYTHYAFLNGTIDGTPITMYSEVTSTTTTPVPNAFLKTYTVVKNADLSPRATHHLLLHAGDKDIDITITGIEGDFLTRDDEKFLRTQSIAKATIQMGSDTRQADAYQERTVSSDADTAVFFTNQNKVAAKTVQFMLWANNGAFYLFDKSDVENPVPYYNSHVWLLYKAADGSLKKSFDGSYVAVPDSNNLGFTVTMPEFNNAVFSLHAPDIYKSQDGRIRLEVEGEVTDESGTYSVRGVGHIVE